MKRVGPRIASKHFQFQMQFSCLGIYDDAQYIAVGAACIDCAAAQPVTKVKGESSANRVSP